MATTMSVPNFEKAKRGGVWADIAERKSPVTPLTFKDVIVRPSRKTLVNELEKIYRENPQSSAKDLVNNLRKMYPGVNISDRSGRRMLRKIQFSIATDNSMRIASQMIAQENDENVSTENFLAPVQKHSKSSLTSIQEEDRKEALERQDFLHRIEGLDSPVDPKNIIKSRLRPRPMLRRSFSFDEGDSYDEADDEEFIPRWEQARRASLVEKAWDEADREVFAMKYFNQSMHHIPEELGHEIDEVCDMIGDTLGEEYRTVPREDDASPSKQSYTGHYSTVTTADGGTVTREDFISSTVVSDMSTVTREAYYASEPEEGKPMTVTREDVAAMPDFRDPEIGAAFYRGAEEYAAMLAANRTPQFNAGKHRSVDEKTCSARCSVM